MDDAAGDEDDAAGSTVVAVLPLKEDMVDGVGDPGGRWMDMEETVTVESSELRDPVDGDSRLLEYIGPLDGRRCDWE